LRADILERGRLWGATMKWHKAAIGGALMFVVGLVARSLPASAQTFESYRCADGTHFILAFYPSDEHAYLQIDGRAVRLKKRLAVFGKRYSGGGVSLTLTATAVFIRHVRRPVTECEHS
jgi:membrane-bound lysozyme inhibitor of c-type lysozyme MliC